MMLLDVKNLTKYYGGEIPALDNVSFSVRKGELVSVIGPSGSGKSTLLRCINRMIEPTDGDILFDGVLITKQSKTDLRKLRTRIGMIFQHYNLVDRLTVIENVLHGRLGNKSTLAGVLGRYSQEEKNQACKVIDILGLSDQIYKRCDALSGGQKQRVGIARALVQDPKVILCDEPIASLDPNSAKIIMDHLRNVSNEMGITVIVNLHQVHMALNYSDRIIGINSGRVVYNGTRYALTAEKIHEIYGSEAGELSLDMGERYAG